MTDPLIIEGIRTINLLSNSMKSHDDICRTLPPEDRTARAFYSLRSAHAELELIAHMLRWHEELDPVEAADKIEQCSRIIEHVANTFAPGSRGEA